MEEHEAVAAMLCGKVTKGDVWKGANEVQVADNGEPIGRRRKLTQKLFSCSCSGHRRCHPKTAVVREQKGEKRADEQDRDH
jgi:hypothetical protein